MRRANLEVTGFDNILNILNNCEVLRIGLCFDNKPYIVPMNFAYEVIDDKVSIYMHCALEGKKLDILSKNDNVCFEADRSYKLLKGENACNWSAEFESVMGEGNIFVVTDEAQKIKALDTLMKRHGFEGKPDYDSRVLSRVNILKISVTSITGKRKMKVN